MDPKTLVNSMQDNYKDTTLVTSHSKFRKPKIMRKKLSEMGERHITQKRTNK